jgi:hypothetical protein
MNTSEAIFLARVAAAYARCGATDYQTLHAKRVLTDMLASIDRLAAQRINAEGFLRT